MCMRMCVYLYHWLDGANTVSPVLFLATFLVLIVIQVSQTYSLTRLSQMVLLCGSDWQREWDT